MVQRPVRNAGWPAAGIYNSDGKVADLGAIPPPTYTPTMS